VLTALVKDPPEPLLSHVPSLPADVVGIIEKTMAREKSRRYPVAKALAEDIEHYLAGRPLNEEPRGARSRTMWGRLKGLLGGASES
jgi:hypothetical protein